VRLYGAGRPGFAGTGNGSVLGWWWSVRKMVVTPGEIDAVCRTYNLFYYTLPHFPEGVGHVVSGEYHIRVSNLHLMTPDEFENLVLTWVIENLFGS
jgi:hypothetical protein